MDAKFGSTGWADCIREGQLKKYITDSKSGKRLSAEEVGVLAQAFSGLARMDPHFSARAEVVPDDKRADAATCGLGELTRA